jgi:CSLREA domain-containing protein
MRIHAALALALVVSAASLGASTINVNSLGDSVLTNANCTLREAILNANYNAATYPDCAAGAGADVINLPAGTIEMLNPGLQEDAGLIGDFDVWDSVTINGHPSGTTINGKNFDRIFDFNSTVFGGPSPGLPITVFLSNLNIVNGTTVGDGGGIQLYAAVTATLTSVTITNCQTNNDGGAMNVGSDSSTTLINCTISGNQCTWLYGGIRTDSPMTMIGCTVTKNRTTGGTPTRGQGLGGGMVTLKNTILAGNGSGPGQPDAEASLISFGYNIIGELGGSSITPAAGDQIGVSAAAVALAPLANNGGPVRTHALNAGSIAIDQGSSFGVATDARGSTRPCDQPAIANAAGGDGADIGAFEAQATCVAANVAPDAVNDNAVVVEDSGANPINVRANDTDADADMLTITAVTQGANGVVSTNGTSVSYTPAPNFSGADSFTYTITDGHSHTDSATVNVTVLSVNDPPVVAGEAYTINQDTPLNVAAPGLLANDSDVDGDPLQAVSYSGGATAHGTLSGSANGSFTYTPHAGYAGTDSFTYRVTDGAATSAPVTVHITIKDTQAPAITASLATTQLWPPDHDLIDAGFTASATDNGGGPVSLSYAVYSDEDDVTPANGDMSPDAKNVAPSSLRLRAERDPTSDGRVYLVVVTATDASSNTSTKCLTAVVPKNLSSNAIASVNAQAAAASAACSAAFVVGDGPVIGPKQ